MPPKKYLGTKKEPNMHLLKHALYFWVVFCHLDLTGITPGVLLLITHQYCKYDLVLNSKGFPVGSVCQGSAYDDFSLE